MKLLSFLLASLFTLAVFAHSAEARPQRAEEAGSSRHHVHHQKHRTARAHSGPQRRYARSHRRATTDDVASTGLDFEGSRPARFHSASWGGSFGAGPRPRAWCGWWMRTQLGGGPEYNLAWNWSRWGSPGSPQVGAVVVWRHHVGMITGQPSSGQWIVKSGNDSHTVRERPRSIAGAVVRI